MAVTQLNGEQIKVTSIPVGDINASGTPSSTTYLRGDGQWMPVTAAPSDQNPNLLTQASNYTIPAGYGLVVPSKYTVGSGFLLTIGLNAILAVK